MLSNQRPENEKDRKKSGEKLKVSEKCCKHTFFSGAFPAGAFPAVVGFFSAALGGIFGDFRV